MSRILHTGQTIKDICFKYQTQLKHITPTHNSTSIYTNRFTIQVVCDRHVNNLLDRNKQIQYIYIYKYVYV